MNQLLDISILLFGVLTYGSAVYQMRTGAYSPSFFSRGVWLLLGINSFAGVALGGGSQSSKILAATLLVGNAAVFVASIKKGSRQFGFTEQISLFLFVVSCALWFVIDAPEINLMLSLAAHFIGGIPTIWRTIKKPSSEKALHWYFFFVASVLTIINSGSKGTLYWKAIIFPLYFVLFDGLIIFLVQRRRFLKR